MILSISIFILLLLLSSSTILTFDDYSENLSINTGETATFICDLPERYSNKPVSFYAIYHLIYKKKENGKKHHKI